MAKPPFTGSIPVGASKSALPNFIRTNMPDEKKTFDWSEIAQFLPFIASATLAFISISLLYSPAHACGAVSGIMFLVGEQMWAERFFVIWASTKIPSRVPE